LHQNPSNSKARGHIGTELVNKAETVLSVFKDNNIIVVESTESRNKATESFAFEIIDGLPSLVGNYELIVGSKKSSSKTKSLDDLQKQQLLNLAYKNKTSYTYGQLVIQLISLHEATFRFKIGRNKIVEMIAYSKDKKWLLQKEEKKPYTLGKF
jgi:hypothetical protein